MRILVLRALGLGDLLTAVPALRGLRRAFPDAEITLAAPAWLADVVERIDAVDRLLPTEALAPIDFDRPGLAVNLHGRGPQSVARLLATGPRRLITYDVWRENRHEVLRWCDLLEGYGIRCDPEDLCLPAVGARTDRIVIHPGASHGSRRWPADRFAAVARELPNVVVTASPGEVPLARRIVRDPFVGSLAELLDLVATARLVICGDTGVAHVATAYGTPSVVLFGPVSPKLWGPLSGPHRVLWHGRTGDTFARSPDPGLLEITVDEVLEAVGGVLCRESVSSARATSA
ncbi:glycosyl transferase [Lentzea sp. NBRC 105346]|uniref:glycosyltransferase family 9 protein n=1 Tax=Lentzea sp. NBRC 105346 TaxID=3032205 RepID=UPI0024A419F7|nr:glycosyltransferase family 9 protein [Lentzea sp. NBRC 105346]GLZ29177.1 glycosyl transferase [Lentzea sp. NBRC 105346]